MQEMLFSCTVAERNGPALLVHKVVEARSETSSENMALRMLSLAVVGLDSERKSRFLCYPFSVPQCQCLCETSRN